MQRRALLGSMAVVTLLLRPLAALAQWHQEAFSAVQLAGALRALFGDRTPEPSAAITLDVEPKIENGAVVPVQISAAVDAVTCINIFAEKNPNPLLARFHLSARCRPVVATRVKMGAPSDLLIVAETRDRLLSTRRFVEVVEGGCS
jgi:sulfur-oxidizing protein SoxY